ncbi:MAG: hypothetical protein ABGX26_02185 [Nautiliaceae bacterium]|jgi:hypothetical protein
MKKTVLLSMVAAALFGFNSLNNSSHSNYQTTSPNLKGKVIKAYIQPGYGPRGYNWLFMDVKSDNGNVYKVGIAPTFVYSNLPINEGDEVEVSGVTPPTWPSDSIRAWDIYDVTQHKDYPIRGMARGYRWGWR